MTGAITIGSDVAIASKSIGGTIATITLFNYEDIEGFTESAGRITAIDLVTDAKGYQFTGCRMDTKKTEEAINLGVGCNMWKHTASFVIYERTQAQKNNIEEINTGLFVAIIENKGKDADAFEVIGKTVGIELVVGAVRDAHANGGWFTLNLATPDGEGERKLPQSLGTDYADAVTVLDALLIAAV